MTLYYVTSKMSKVFIMEKIENISQTQNCQILGE